MPTNYPKNSTLDKQQREFLSKFIKASRQAVQKLDLHAEICQDMVELKQHLASKRAIINPSFDADEHTLKSCFWLKIRNQDGEIIACHAERVFETRDFISELIETGRLWWDASKPIPPSNWRNELSAPDRLIHGRVAYAGSMLIDPKYRGIGLSRYLPYLSRAIAIQDLDTDFHTGIVRQSLAASRVPRENYGFSQIDQIFHGLLPGVAGEPEAVFLCWMDRSEALTTLENAAIGTKFPIYL